MRLNHAVLYVRDVERSGRLLRGRAGLRPRMTELPGAVFLRAPGSTNDHDLGLFGVGDEAGPTGAGRGTVGLYHLAWEVDTLDELVRLEQRLRRARRAGRCQRPRLDQGALRAGPRRHRVRGELARPGRPDWTREPRPSAPNRSTSRASEHATAAPTRGGVGVSIPVSSA